MKSTSLGGVELDIAIGGQTGADTRLYASQQTRLYRSFAPVVLVLKVLLNQQDLDMPFTGTLSSSSDICVIIGIILNSPRKHTTRLKIYYYYIPYLLPQGA
jgi:DNA polymerase sigma